MRRSKILSGILALIPAVLLVTSRVSLGADECRIKPDATAPAGLHWYYRVDRANNRHCWYLHAQGLPVHAGVAAKPRDRDVQNEEVDDDVPKAPVTPVVGTAQPVYQQAETLAGRRADFTSRWVDLPKSVDLNTHEVAASNGFAAEPAVADTEERFPPTWPNVSAVSGDTRQNAAAGTSFGSISLAGAAILALLLMSEAVVRFVRRSGWTLLHGRLPAAPTEESEIKIEPSPQSGSSRTTIESISGPLKGAGELRRLLHRAGTGLTPPQSFAPSRSKQHDDQSRRNRGPGALQRLKSRSFRGVTWAPL